MSSRLFLMHRYKHSLVVSRESYLYYYYFPLSPAILGTKIRAQALRYPLPLSLPQHKQVPVIMPVVRRQHSSELRTGGSGIRWLSTQYVIQPLSMYMSLCAFVWLCYACISCSLTRHPNSFLCFTRKSHVPRPLPPPQHPHAPPPPPHTHNPDLPHPHHLPLPPHPPLRLPPRHLQPRLLS